MNTTIFQMWKGLRADYLGHMLANPDDVAGAAELLGELLKRMSQFTAMDACAWNAWHAQRRLQLKP